MYEGYLNLVEFDDDEFSDIEEEEDEERDTSSRKALP
jgi:hypothetical protein